MRSVKLALLSASHSSNWPASENAEFGCVPAGV